MRVQQEQQLNPVADEVLALTAVVRPILKGTLYALKADIVAEVGGYDNVKLKMLPRFYRAGDGDCGICFEYAVHEAMNSGEAVRKAREPAHVHPHREVLKLNVGRGNVLWIGSALDFDAAGASTYGRAAAARRARRGAVLLHKLGVIDVGPERAFHGVEIGFVAV